MIWDMRPMAAAARAMRPPFRWLELADVQKSCPSRWRVASMRACEGLGLGRQG